MKNATVINANNEIYNSFTKEFWDAIHEDLYDNAYIRIYIDKRSITNPEEYSNSVILVSKELISKGYTEEDIILFDNRW